MIQATVTLTTRVIDRDARRTVVVASATGLLRESVGFVLDSFHKQFADLGLMQEIAGTPESEYILNIKVEQK